MATNVMNGATSWTAEASMYELLKACDRKQFANAMSSSDFRAQLESELSSESMGPLSRTASGTPISRCLRPLIGKGTLMQLVIIFGPPAVGKMTVGRALAERTGFKLFHNHMTSKLALAFSTMVSRLFIAW